MMHDKYLFFVDIVLLCNLKVHSFKEMYGAQGLFDQEILKIQLLLDFKPNPTLINRKIGFQCIKINKSKLCLVPELFRLPHDYYWNITRGPLKCCVNLQCFFFYFHFVFTNKCCFTCYVT